MKFFYFLLLVSGLSLQTFSQTNTKTDDIRRLLELTGSGKIGTRMAQALIENYQKTYSKVDSSFWQEFSQEINPEELVNLTVPIYDKYFTWDEIRQLINFYETPTGKKIISTLPAIMDEAMNAGQAWGRAISEKILKRLKEKGYAQNM